MTTLDDAKRILIAKYLEIVRDETRSTEERQWAADEALELMGIDLCEL